MAKDAQPEKTSDESKMSHVLLKKIKGAILFKKVTSKKRKEDCGNVPD